MILLLYFLLFFRFSNDNVEIKHYHVHEQHKNFIVMFKVVKKVEDQKYFGEIITKKYLNESNSIEFANNNQIYRLKNNKNFNLFIDVKNKSQDGKFILIQNIKRNYYVGEEIKIDCYFVEKQKFQEEMVEVYSETK